MSQLRNIFLLLVVLLVANSFAYADISWVQLSADCAEFSENTRKYLSETEGSSHLSLEHRAEIPLILEAACGGRFKSCDFNICAESPNSLQMTEQDYRDLLFRISPKDLPTEVGQDSNTLDPLEWLSQQMSCEEFLTEVRTRYSAFSNSAEIDLDSQDELQIVLKEACGVRFSSCSFPHCNPSSSVAPVSSQTPVAIVTPEELSTSSPQISPFATSVAVTSQIAIDPMEQAERELEVKARSLLEEIYSHHLEQLNQKIASRNAEEIAGKKEWLKFGIPAEQAALEGERKRIEAEKKKRIKAKVRKTVPAQTPSPFIPNASLPVIPSPGASPEGQRFSPPVNYEGGNKFDLDPRFYKYRVGVKDILRKVEERRKEEEEQKKIEGAK